MKVVINVCFGGFSLSDAAVRLYADRKGLTLYPAKDGPMTVYYTVPADKRTPPLAGHWQSHSIEARKAYNEAYSREHLYDHDIDRADPDLVAVVEQLGAAANGRCAQLKVIKIPDGVDWEVDEYDGNEHIAEKHRSWR